MVTAKKNRDMLFYEFRHLVFGCTLLFIDISDVIDDAGRIGLRRGMAALAFCRVPPCLWLWVASPDAGRLPVRSAIHGAQ